LVAWALVATYATTASGVPLPQFSSTSSSGESHPCRTHRCGCTTAEQCWKSCCCYSNREKVAWAAEHGVTPPAFVVAAAEVEAKPVATIEAGKIAEPACCRSKRACCAKSSTCLQATPAEGSHAGAPIARPAEKASTKTSIVFVTWLESRRCRGSTPTWMGVAISLPPSAPVDCPAFDPLVRPWTARPTAAVPLVFSPPAIPPPRAA
jgi:hypothetical protein